MTCFVRGDEEITADVDCLNTVAKTARLPEEIE